MAKITAYSLGGSMTWVHYLLAASFVGLIVIWPISFFGYKFYQDCTHVDQAPHH